jgi:transposase-like protein
VDETYVRVKGRWTYLYRAVDSCGQTIDFLLSAKRDAGAAKRFFRKALAQPHSIPSTDSPSRGITVVTTKIMSGSRWFPSLFRGLGIPRMRYSRDEFATL